MKPIHVCQRRTHVDAVASAPRRRDAPLTRQLSGVRNASGMQVHASGRKGPLSGPGEPRQPKQAREDALDALIDHYRMHRGNPVRILNTAREMLMATNDPGACRDLFDRIEDKLRAVGLHLNRLHVNALLGVCRRGKDMGAAWDVFCGMSARRPPIAPDLITFNTLVTGFGAVGDTTRVSEVRGMMADQGFEPDAFTWTGEMDGYANAGDPARTEGVLRQLMSHPDTSLPDRTHWHIAIKAYDIANQPAQCLRLMREMHAMTPPLQVDPVAYGRALRACARIGDWQTACALKHDMDARQPPVAFGAGLWEALLQSFVTGRNPDGAETVLRCMQAPDSTVTPSIESYGGVIAGFYDAYRPRDAMRLLLEAMAVGIVAPDAGYNPYLKTLDFHRSAVAGIPGLKHGQKGVSVGMAVTLLAWLMASGTLDPRTVFIVGQGEGLLRDAILGALAEAGRPYAVDPDNAGRLVPRQAAEASAGISRPGRSGSAT